jgi:hypothetical protein
VHVVLGRFLLVKVDLLILAAEVEAVVAQEEKFLGEVMAAQG